MLGGYRVLDMRHRLGWGVRDRETEVHRYHTRSALRVFEGVVRLQGTVQGPASGTVFQLPDGYRPAGTVRAIVSTQASGGGNLGTAQVAVDSDGVVTISSGDTLDFLDAVSFRAAG